MTDDDTSADDIGPGNFALMRSLIAEGKPDRALSRQALATFCRIARAQRPGASPFPPEMLDWIADAFERYLSGEAPDIAKSLGLKTQGKPVDPKTEGRNWVIAARVAALIDERDDGKLTDNRQGEGIFADVAGASGTTESVVRDIWYQTEQRVEWYRSEEGKLLTRTTLAYPMQEQGRIMLRLSRMLGARESKQPDSPKSQG
jgi:hypothetical protein